MRFLEEQKKKEPEAFKEFYTEYNFFLKEGVCHDFKFMDQISKLLMFESSKEDGRGTNELGRLRGSLFS